MTKTTGRPAGSKTVNGAEAVEVETERPKNPAAVNRVAKIGGERGDGRTYETIEDI